MLEKLISFFKKEPLPHIHSFSINNRLPWDESLGKDFEPLSESSYYAIYRYRMQCPCGEIRIIERIAFI